MDIKIELSHSGEIDPEKGLNINQQPVLYYCNYEKSFLKDTECSLTSNSPFFLSVSISLLMYNVESKITVFPILSRCS